MEKHLFFDEFLHEIVEVLGTALDAKNPYTCGHSERVAELSLKIAKQMNFTKKEQLRIHIGAHLHDIGKIGIPDAILNKIGKLTGEEFAVMKNHTCIGAEIVGKISVLDSIIDIVRHHHERIDGNGYPDGLRGNEISIGARIVSIADAFDAMTSARAYRTALRTDEAVKELIRCSGTQFDSCIVQLCKNYNLFDIKNHYQINYNKKARRDDFV